MKNYLFLWNSFLSFRAPRSHLHQTCIQFIETIFFVRLFLTHFDYFVVCMLMFSNTFFFVIHSIRSHQTVEVTIKKTTSTVCASSLIFTSYSRGVKKQQNVNMHCMELACVCVCRLLTADCCDCCCLFEEHANSIFKFSCSDSWYQKYSPMCHAHWVRDWRPVKKI